MPILELSQNVALSFFLVPHLRPSQVLVVSFLLGTWWSWHTTICPFTWLSWHDATGTFIVLNVETQVINSNVILQYKCIIVPYDVTEKLFMLVYQPWWCWAAVTSSEKHWWRNGLTLLGDQYHTQVNIYKYIYIKQIHIYIYIYKYMCVCLRWYCVRWRALHLSGGLYRGVEGTSSSGPRSFAALLPPIFARSDRETGAASATGKRQRKYILCNSVDTRNMTIIMYKEWQKCKEQINQKGGFSVTILQVLMDYQERAVDLAEDFTVAASNVITTLAFGKEVYLWFHSLVHALGK